jgi:hypothetical protein
MSTFRLILMSASGAAHAALQNAPAAAQQGQPDSQAQQQAERYAEPNAPIVVTGIRIQDYRDRLAACLARNCPPDEDIDATLALAEALVIEGDYREGRSAVRASLRRNDRHAAAYPEPVSDLYRVDSRIARNLGQDRQALRSSYGILESLQRGLPREDHRHFTARFELAELQMMTGRVESARTTLAELARAAHAAGRGDVVTMAELRRLWYDYYTEPRGPTRARLEEMSRSTDPAQRFRATGARILLARILRAEGEVARADALLAELARGPSNRRRLIDSPAYRLVQQEISDGDDDIRPSSTINRLTQNYEGKWIDVGFWITPEGRVDGLEILRRGGHAAWARPLLQSIQGRTYSTGEEATYRLERYTMTARLEPATGSHLLRHSPQARVEYLDLTIAEAPPPSPPETRPN